MLLAITTAVVFIDQLTKWLICKNLGDHERLEVIPGFFNLYRVYNEGAAFGMLAGQRTFLVCISLGMFAFLWWNRRDFIQTGALGRIGLGLLTGGIIGNLIDRIKLGYVIDFLDFHWRNAYSFATFNIADSTIFIGIALYFIQTLLLHKRN